MCNNLNFTSFFLDLTIVSTECFNRIILCIYNIDYYKIFQKLIIYYYFYYYYLIFMNFYKLITTILQRFYFTTHVL